mgnify:CR=1 FL=1
MGRRWVAPVIQTVFRKLVLVAAHPGGGTGINVAAEENTQDEPESVSRKKPRKKEGKREEELEGLPVVVVEHSMTDEELEDKFGKKRLEIAPG